VASTSADSVSSSAPVVLDAAPVASTSSGAHTVEVAIPIVIVVLALLFMGWRLGGRKRRGGEGGEGSGGDESGE
jgi:hypothetical protein